MRRLTANIAAKNIDNMLVDTVKKLRTILTLITLNKRNGTSYYASYEYNNMLLIMIDDYFLIYRDI